MQGGWLLATAVGNKLLSVGSFFWEKIALWQLWSHFRGHLSALSCFYLLHPQEAGKGYEIASLHKMP